MAAINHARLDQSAGLQHAQQLSRIVSMPDFGWTQRPGRTTCLSLSFSLQPEDCRIVLVCRRSKISYSPRKLPATLTCACVVESVALRFAPRAGARLARTLFRGPHSPREVLRGPACSPSRPSFAIMPYLAFVAMAALCFARHEDQVIFHQPASSGTTPFSSGPAFIPATVSAAAPLRADRCTTILFFDSGRRKQLDVPATFQPLSENWN